MVRFLALVLLLPLGLAACTGGDPSTGAARPGSPGPASSAPGHPLRSAVADPAARLLGQTAVVRHGKVVVTAAWQAGSRRVIVSSDDRFATVTYRHWTAARARDSFGVGADAEPGVLGGLLAQPVATVGGNGGALVGGGDGATLLPFEAAARLEGTRWRRYAVPRVAGERAYVDGAVVLPDGRLLALLDHWSGDRGRHLSTPHHGLWVSAGGDWGSYAPDRPRFVPALADVAGGASPFVGLGGTSGRSGLVWVLTAEQQLYVSRDGQVFRETPMRPLI